MLPGRWNSRRRALAWSKSDLGRRYFFVCRGLWVFNAPPQTRRKSVYSAGNSGHIPSDPRGPIHSLTPLYQLLSRRLKSIGDLGNDRLSIYLLAQRVRTACSCPCQHSERRGGVVIQLVSSRVFVQRTTFFDRRYTPAASSHTLRFRRR